MNQIGAGELRLSLVRHGEAEYPKKGADFDRRLTPRGIQQATWLSQQLKTVVPLVIVSQAARAAETAEILWARPQGGASPQKRLVLRGVYMAEKKDLLQLISSTAADGFASEIMVVGHNPGLSQLAQWLWGQDVSMATADLIVLGYRADSWAEALSDHGSWQMIQQLNNPC